MFAFLKKLFGFGDNSELIERLQSKPFLVDVRTPAEFSSGSVQGAVNVPLDKITTQLSKFENKNNIIVFCRSGMRSSQAKAILNKNGFENVLNGGTWQNIANQINALKKLKH